MQMLRQMLLLSSTVLLVPVATGLSEVLVCDGTWRATDWTCFSGVHLGVVLPALGLLGIFGIVVLAGVVLLPRSLALSHERPPPPFPPSQSRLHDTMPTAWMQ
jgi:hypothetical protein